MSIADCRAARRKNLLRYGRGNSRNVAEAIADERRKAARQAASATKRPKSK